jgi:lysozyme family protein
VWYDTYFTHSNPNVTKTVQAVAGADVDGYVGPDTIAAVNAMSISKLNEAITALNEYRLQAYTRSPLYAKYGNGWKARIALFAANVSAITSISKVGKGNITKIGIVALLVGGAIYMYVAKTSSTT